MMTHEQTAAKIESLCERLEDLLAELSAAAEKRGGPYAKLRETYPNAGKPWSKHDDEELRKLHDAGNSVADLAALFGRTNNGVRVRLERLGIIQPVPVAAVA